MEVFQIVFNKCTTVTDAIEGFKKSGMFLWDPMAIKDKKLPPSTMYEKQAELLDVNTLINEGRQTEVGLETRDKPEDDDQTPKVTEVVGETNSVNG